ncbi:hypothetical protein D3C74_272730 [compost metagenome]
MIWYYEVLLEKPLLDRGQFRYTLNDSLFCCTRLSLKVWKQSGNGLLLEQIFYLYLEFVLIQAGSNLDRFDGVSTQLKEIIVNAYFRHPQDIGPYVS